jgi:hypothetical protein
MVERGADHEIVVVDDLADIVVAGQVVDAQTGLQGASEAEPDPAVPSSQSTDQEPADPESATMTPLLGATGGMILAAVVATGAAGARWRRRRARRQASREATERLVELLSGAQEAPPAA